MAFVKEDERMIRSMTGYGRGEVASENAAFIVEMRSVNNRFLDIQVKTPRNLGMLEPRIKKTVQTSFGRGRIDVFVNRTGKEASPMRIAADFALAEQYLGILTEMKQRFSLPGDVDLASMQSFPDIIGREELTEDPEKIWLMLTPALTQAAERLRSMREDEGAVLAQDMKDRLAAIEKMASLIRDRVPAAIEQARLRLTEAVARIMKEQPDPARMVQEIAIIADRTDITEELIRLGSHITQFRRLLDLSGEESVGRKLDFLVQEMGREVNTVGSKALDADISMTVVNMKAELEKIREQAQNIE